MTSLPEDLRKNPPTLGTSLRALLALASLLNALLLVTAHASSVKALAERIKTTAKPDIGITKSERELAEQLQAHGSHAVPHLLPLLRHENEAVRQLAAYTLRDTDGVTEEHLDELMEACRRGEGWIPPAIARVGTPRAVEFLVSELVRRRETQNQLTYAIELLGEKAVPSLLEVFTEDGLWDEDLEHTLYSVFRSLGVKAASAVEPLLKISCDEQMPEARRVRAIRAIGAVGPVARGVVPQLQKLQEHGSAALRDAIAATMVETRSAEAVPVLIQSLQDAPDADERELRLWEIAALGSRGVSAGPTVVSYLTDDSWDLRVAAARTLGRIGYTESREQLVELLNRADDWRLVFRAAEALGLLKSEEALSALTDLKKNHWYPPVREAAAAAIKAIASKGNSEDKNDDENSSGDLVELANVGEKLGSLEEKEAERLRLKTVAPKRRLHIQIKGEDGALHALDLLGVKVEDGHIIGTDHGEWGGHISFIDSDGHSHLLAEENTEAIYETPVGVFAVTGLAHLSLNTGFIFKIQRTADQGWRAQKWRALPGAPQFSRLLEDGRIFVSCHGGIVVVSADGEMKSMTRDECLRVSGH